MTSLLIFLTSLSMAKAENCLLLPKNFSLKGASFEEGLEMQPGMNCRATWRFANKIRSSEIANNDGAICLNNAASLLTTEKTCGDQLVKKLNDIQIKTQIKGVFETSGTDLLLFSTKDGKKDLSLPYLKFKPQPDRGLLVEAWENSKQIGEVNLIDTHCAAEAHPVATEPYEIRAHQFIANEPSASCKNGGLSKANFKEGAGGTGRKRTTP